MLVRKLNQSQCEAFLNKYPLIARMMFQTQTTACKKGLQKGYLQFLDMDKKKALDEMNVTYTEIADAYNEKIVTRFYELDFCGTAGYAKVYQYLYDHFFAIMN